MTTKGYIWKKTFLIAKSKQLYQQNTISGSGSTTTITTIVMIVTIILGAKYLVFSPQDERKMYYFAQLVLLSLYIFEGSGFTFQF